MRILPRMIRNFVAVTDLWDTLVTLADDLVVSEGVVRQWRRRDSIPARHWGALVAAAQKRGYGNVTLDLLARLAEDRDKRRPLARASVEPVAA